MPPVSETIPETTEQEEFLEEDPFGNTEEPENETGSMDTMPEKAPGTEGELEEVSEEEEEDGDDLSFLEEFPEDEDSQEEAEENEPEKTEEEDSETETDLDGGDSIFDELEEVLFEDEKGPDTDGEILNLQDDTPQDTDSTSGQDSLEENSSGNSDENFKPVEFHDDEDFTLNDDYLFDDSGISEDDLDEPSGISLSLTDEEDTEDEKNGTNAPETDLENDQDSEKEWIKQERENYRIKIRTQTLGLLLFLRELVNNLPKEKRSQFLESNARVKMEYLIDKLSGKQGLTKAAENITDGTENKGTEENISSEKIRDTLTYMKNLTRSLADNVLATALEKQVDKVMDKLV